MKEKMLDFDQQGRITVGTIKTSSVLSAVNVVEFGNEVLAHVQDNPGLNLLLNFEHVDYLSSAVLTELLRVKKAIDETSGHLRLCGVSPAIHEVFKITNLDRIFVVHEDGVDLEVNRFERALDIEAEDAAWNDI